jgi:hypothetical protein
MFTLVFTPSDPLGGFHDRRRARRRRRYASSPELRTPSQETFPTAKPQE